MNDHGPLSYELPITRIAITVTACAAAAATADIVLELAYRVAQRDLGGVIEQSIFLVIVLFLIYGALVYQIARLGYLTRRAEHRPAGREELERVFGDADAPSLVVLVPSYKEELHVIRKTLVSAALQEYPKRSVVLLIDDPPEQRDNARRHTTRLNRTNEDDARSLRAARLLPLEIREWLAKPRRRFEEAQAAYLQRLRDGSSRPHHEAMNLAHLNGVAAAWFSEEADHITITDHSDLAYVDHAFRAPSIFHTDRATEWRSHAQATELDSERIRIEFARLAALFAVELSSFERKQYANLSHEPNKAMNLNSYIGVMGGCYANEDVGDKRTLVRVEDPELADFEFPDADFVLTLDADSLLRGDYALRLAHEMRKSGSERIAVMQTPYSAFTGASGLERIAGATTDIQYIIHQGFTRHGATYWVGANALIRKAALKDIAVQDIENGHPITRFIQDRTVIEDTESSVDLATHGWTLHNYCERMAWSATPPDFGSLLIQRRRWANGGLIILPKLVRYLLGGGRIFRRMAEAFMRFHYLTSIAAVNIGLLVVLSWSFDRSIHGYWLPLTALSYYVLYMRDLRQIGYRARDLLGVYALNLLLVPINLGGVFKSISQALSGQRTPFGRTPKVSGRTAAPFLYVFALYLLIGQWLVGCAFDCHSERWLHAGFAAANAAFLAYAVVAFVGVRASMEDLGIRMPGFLRSGRNIAGQVVPS
ncbi:MAG: glycosyltransferase family 2 protein [Planctomycetes bacterium]|nr:glycosyltransferase family 2 protein [Planctomycetota bacterium]